MSIQHATPELAPALAQALTGFMPPPSDTVTAQSLTARVERSRLATAYAELEDATHRLMQALVDAGYEPDPGPYSSISNAMFDVCVALGPSAPL